ncbi:hypothetical protein FW774_14780 [Pedobacter sp. BS3]|uniref:SRPBCC family protein n=1 Tax=Pedobacter sp. BS3 TaxID=2567937 RepID=UPI0011ED2809|nr:SRPBCC family protein [Pedobacter sp. BS3]TZF82755.1 hypothetical protein FW774_14780 [Pedobacter sp. BS3]
MSETENREMRITKTVKAPVALVWDVWTRPEYIIHWWGPKGFTSTIHTLDFKEGGEWKLTLHGPDGTDYPNRSIFKEIIPFKKIVFEHFNPHFITAVLFEAVGEETQIDWTMLFDTAEMREIIIKTHKADEGQKQNIERLEEYLLQKKQHGPIVIERTFDAPLQTVWEALTNAEALREWSFDIKNFEAKVGFEFEFWGKGKEGEDYLHKCVVTEVQEPVKLAYSWRYEGFEGISYVTYKLQADGDKTHIKLMHAGLETFPAVSAFAKESFMEGWTALIGTLLRDYVEKN